MKARILLAGVFFLARLSSAGAQDLVKKVSGETLRGTVKQVTSTEITLDDKQVPVVEIDFIRFGDEPAQLNAVRNQIGHGGYENALKALDKIDAAKIERREIQHDLKFYRALAQTRLALGGGADVAEAGRQMLAFIQENPDSYHVLDANGLVGDLLVAAGKYGDATRYYQAMGEAPFPEYKMRAGVSTGRALVKQQQYEQALAEFEKVLALAGQASGPAAESQAMAATLGKAECLSRTGQGEQGADLVEEVIARLPPESAELHARAYVTLGNCYVQSKSTKQALLAFLHVDVLYFGNPEAHAEALWNLAVLWNDVGKPQRALEASQLLKERYAGSEWARR